MKLRTFVIPLAAAALLISACGSDDNGATEAPTGTAATIGTANADADATVMVATHDDLGDYLVDGHGRTLYLFTADQGTTTACTADCVDAWPPMVAAEPIAGSGVEEAQLGTAAGIDPDQVTFAGHLLYFFAGDITPGDTNGVGLPQWYAVDPSGEPIE